MKIYDIENLFTCDKCKRIFYPDLMRRNYINDWAIRRMIFSSEYQENEYIKEYVEKELIPNLKASNMECINCNESSQDFYVESNLSFKDKYVLDKDFIEINKDVRGQYRQLVAETLIRNWSMWQEFLNLRNISDETIDTAYYSVLENIYYDFETKEFAISNRWMKYQPPQIYNVFLKLSKIMKDYLKRLY